MALEIWNERDSVQPGRRLHSRQLGHGRQEIPESNDGIAGCFRGNDARPARKERNANASFIQIPFDSVERSVAVEEVRIVSSFFMWSVIAGEKTSV